MLSKVNFFWFNCEACGEQRGESMGVINMFDNECVMFFCLAAKYLFRFRVITKKKNKL
jgi:hypothetical protein